MSKVSYEYYKKKFDEIKPIRGRAVDVRPIGKRYRDWEVIRAIEKPEGKAYAVRLYQTDCVEYLPGGDVVVRSGGWATNSTAEFIHEHSPFACFRQKKVLWVRVLTRTGPKVYPLGMNAANEVKFKWTGEHTYEPEEPIVIHKKVVDRVKAKRAREPLMPFLAWTKMFLSLSEGWVMYDTVEEVRNNLQPRNYLQFYEYLSTCGADGYLAGFVYLMLRMPTSGIVDTRIADTITKEYTINGAVRKYTVQTVDRRVSFEAIKRALYKMVNSAVPSVHKIVDVDPSNEAVPSATREVVF